MSAVETHPTQFKELFQLSDWSKYLPKDIAQGYAAEGDARFSNILARLSVEPRPPCSFELDHAFELLQSFEDQCFNVDLKSAVSLALALWNLLARCAVEKPLYCHNQCRMLGRHLRNWLVRIHNEHRAPVWLEEAATNGAETEVAKLTSTIDVRLLIRLIINEMALSSRKDTGIPDSERTGLVHDVVDLCAGMRDFIDAAVAMDIIQELGKNLDGRYGHMMVYARLIILLTPRSCAADLLKSGRLWEWWSTMPEGLVPKFDLMWFAILSRNAKQEWIGQVDDASKASLKQNLPWVLNRIYRTLNLPLCSPSAGALDNAKELRAVPGLDRYAISGEIEHNVMGGKTNWSKVAKFIVYSLEAEPPSDADSESGGGDHDVNLDNAWTWVTVFVRHMAPFFQPGGAHGEWHFHCFTLVQQIVKAYFKRSGRERLLDTKVPAKNRLTRAADERIVRLLLPVVNNCLQSDNPIMLIQSLEIFAQISQLAASYSPAYDAGQAPDPFSVDVPAVFRRALEFLNDPEQSGKHAALFQVFGRALPSILLRWPALVNDILAVVLWGIDVTDLPKTLSSLTLITVMFTHIPCVDISDWPSAGSNITLSKKRWAVVGQPDASCDDDSGAQIVASMLPSFCSDFFERLCEFIKMLTKQTKNGSGFLDKIEDLALKLIHTAMHLVAAQLSSSMYKNLLESLKCFATTNLLVDQAKPAAALTSAIARVDPQAAVPLLLPPLVAKLSSKSTKGALKDDLSESEAKWYLSILVAVIRHGGDALLPYRSDLEGLIKGALADERDDVVKLGAKLMRRTLFTITATYIPSDFRVCGADTWKRLNTSKSADAVWPLKWWGWTAPWWTQETPGIAWHEPSDVEVAWARDLVHGVLAQVTQLLPSTGVALPPACTSATWLDGLAVPAKKRASHKVKLGLMLTRATLRGICGLWLDERTGKELEEVFVPVVSRHEGDMGRVIFETFAHVLMATTRALSSEECSALTTESDVLPAGIDQVEIAGLLSKVTECTSEVLRSPGSHSCASAHILSAGLRSLGGHGMLSMFRLDNTPLELLHEDAKWRSLPRIWWTLTICDLLDARHRDRCREHQYAGWRKEVVETMCVVAMRASTASVRESARGVMCAGTNTHLTGDWHLLHEKVLPAVAEETSAVLRCSSVPSDAVDKEELRLNNAVDGIARVLGSKAMMFIAWEHGVDSAASVALVLAEAIYAATRGAADTSAQGKKCEIKTATLSALVWAAQQWIDHRAPQLWVEVRPAEHVFTTERALKVIEIVSKLLEVCSRPDCHWRAQVMSSALIFTLWTSLKDFEAPAGKEDFVRSVWLQWAKWLSTCCEPKAIPGLHAVGVHALSLLLKQPLPLSSADLQEAGFFKKEFFDKLLEVVPKLHHASLLGSGEGGDPTESIVKSVTGTRSFTTWPHAWGSKRSKSFSKRNALFWQSYIRYVAGNMLAENLYSLISGAVEHWATKPDAEQEYHAALVEFFAGTVRALRKPSTKELSARAWALMHPSLRMRLQKASQERLADWCTALRFVSSGTSQLLHRSYMKRTSTASATADKKDAGSTDFLIPLFNFASDPDEVPKQDALRSSFPPINKMDDGAADAASAGDQDAFAQEGSSFGVYKRLRLTLWLLAEPCAVTLVENDKAFCSVYFESLRTGLGHPYKQLREEAARTVVILLLSLSRRGKSISEPIKQWIAQEAERLAPQLRDDIASGQTEASGGSSGRKRHVLESSGLCYVLLHAALERLTSVLLADAIPRCLQFLLAATTHGDFELRVLASSALATCSVAHLPNPMSQGDRSWHNLPMASELIRLLGIVDNGDALTYKERDKAIFMSVRPLLLANSMLLRSQPQAGADGNAICLLRSLRSSVEEALGHAQPEVRNAAKGTIISLLCGDSSTTALSYLKRCRQLAPRPKKGLKPEDCTKEVLAGVVGLSCALCVIADLGAPSWVGQVIEGIAPYGRSGIIDSVRKEVQGTIQTFLKLQQSRQQTWKQLQQKLTPTQLDLLNDYKGKLTYFS